MTLHAVSFSLYNLAVIVLNVSYYFFTTLSKHATAEEKQKITRWTLIAWIGTCYTNFIAQLCLIWIFLQFRHRSQPDRATRLTLNDEETDKTRLPTVTRMSTFDEGQDLKTADRTHSLNVYGDEVEEEGEENRISFVSASDQIPAGYQNTRTVSYRIDRGDSLENLHEDLRTKIINQFVNQPRSVSKSGKSPVFGTKSPIQTKSPNKQKEPRSPISLNSSGHFA